MLLLLNWFWLDVDGELASKWLAIHRQSYCVENQLRPNHELDLWQFSVVELAIRETSCVGCLSRVPDASPILTLILGANLRPHDYATSRQMFH
jgi:hypothetical protein